VKANTLNLFFAMNLIDSSLKDISNQTIINCFKKAKFEFPSVSTQIIVASEVEDETDFWEELKKWTNIEFNSFESFVSVDENECIEFESDLTDEQIIEMVCNHSSEDSNDISDEELDETEEETIVTTSEALDHIIELQKYFCQIGDNSFVDHLNDMQRKVIKSTFKSLKQQKISDFLHNSP
jgi:tRNA A37 methylthiotransferase MiaB